MRKFFLVVPFILFTSIISAESISTSETDDESKYKPLTIVISAARIEQSIENVGSSVTVLSADEIKKRGVKFVADALAEIPSLIVSSQGARGSQTQIRIRGNEANHVLVLVDGVRVGNASTGEYDFANMSLDAVQRIEVLLGPQSTLYGSDALAGVISITTRKGGNGFGGHIQASVGSLNTQSDFAQVYGGENGWHYAATASHFDTEGISVADEDNGNTESDAYESNSVHVKAGFDHSRYKTWVVFGQSDSLFNFDDYDYATGFAIDSTENQQWTNEKLMSWGLSVPALDGRLQNQLQVSNSQYDSKSYTTAFGDSEANTDLKNYSYQGSLKIDETQSAQFGVDELHEQLDTTPNFSAHAKQKGIYTQWLKTINKTNVAIGARTDKHDEFGRHNTYRTTVSHHINDNWRIRGAYGTGFKSPSLSDLYNIAWGGNPDLDPEESSSIEFGIEYARKDYKASATFFNQDTKNLIRYITHPTVSQLENVDDASSQGIELSANANWSNSDLTVTVSKIDATETKDGETNDRLRVPDWAADIIANYFYSNGRVWTEWKYRGKRRDIVFGGPVDHVYLDSYWLLDVGASYELDKNMTLSARIENLTDEDYEEVYSYGTRGRTVTVTVDWRF